MTRKFKAKNATEKLDTTPVAVPLGFNRPPTLHETIQRILRTERFRQSLNGEETFEEADDFDIPDDPIDPSTPWEIPADAEHQDVRGWELDKDTRQLKKKIEPPKKKVAKKIDPPASPEDEQA